MLQTKLPLHKVLVFLVIFTFLFNNTSGSLELYPHKIVPPLTCQEDPPTRGSSRFRDEIISDIKFMTVALFIAGHFIKAESAGKDLKIALREDFIHTSGFLEAQSIDLDSVSEDSGIVSIYFDRNGEKGVARICGRERGEVLALSDPRWEIISQYAILIENDKRSDPGGDRDMKGKNAPKSDHIIRRLIRDERIIEISLDDGRLKAHGVKWDKEYVPGETPRRIYLGKEMEIRRVFSESEARNLTEWIREHPARGALVKIRIVLNEPAIGWRDSIDSSNLAYAGYRDRCIYIGHFFLKYLMGNGGDREALRKEVLEDDELLHLMDSTNVDNLHSGEAYEKRLRNAGGAISLLVEVNRVRKNPAYMWDPEFALLHERAEKMFRDTARINKGAVEALSREYKKYLSGGDERILSREHMGLEKNEVIAYYSMEYAITHRLPFFAGGLGALAGDQVRAASDLLPDGTFVAVGPYSKLGYLTQSIDSETNWQYEEYNRVRIEDFGRIVKDERGNDIVLVLPMPDGKAIYAKAWEVQAGRARLYFLTTDIEENNDNSEYKRYLDLTYDANEEIRLVQEYVVGVGGQRLLQRLGMEPRALHLNEGHVVFALLEKARQLLSKRIEDLNRRTGSDYSMEILRNMPIERRREYGLTLNQVLEVVRKMSGFTSHTPVAAGNQTFQDHIAEKYLGPYLDLFGAQFSDIASEPLVHDGVFDMTEFALTYCNFFNGVSRRHAEVCREMYEGTNGIVAEKQGHDRPEPVNITNAVHRGFYQPAVMQNLLEDKLKGLKKDGLVSGDVTLNNISREDAWTLVNLITDAEMKKVSKEMVKNGIEELKRIRSLRSESGARMLPLIDGEEIEIDPDAFLVVFGRRMTEYKKPAFVLEYGENGDIEVWRSVVREARKMGKKAQILFMGKAHRDDEEGKKILQKILHIAKTDPELKGSILFVEDYNTEVTRAVIKIATVALNNPEPPLEASGTSGMKFQLAGKPSCTVMDGWTLEASLGVFPFATKEALRNIMLGEWRFETRDGNTILGKDADGRVLTHMEETRDGKVIYECHDPKCMHVWPVDKGAQAPEVCEKCGNSAIKNNSYHELGILDTYFNHKERWYQVMRESIVESLSYFTSHRMFKEYVDRMYNPNIRAGRSAEDEFMDRAIEGAEDLVSVIREKLPGKMSQTERGKEMDKRTLFDQVYIPDPIESPGEYAIYEVSRFIMDGKMHKALEVFFTGAGFQDKNLEVAAGILNRLIGISAKNKEKMTDVRMFAAKLIRNMVELSENSEISRSVQLMAGQALTVLSWMDRGVRGAENIRLTAVPGEMVRNDKRGNSFIDASTLPEGIDEVKEEGKAGFFWRGIERIGKLGRNIGEDIKFDDGRFDNAEDNLVMYLMDHGFIKVPGGLQAATESGTITTVHETFFVNDFLPGSSQTTSTGAGHFQGLNLDIKHVTEGRGVQLNVKYNEKNEITEVIAQKINAGDWCLALPGYVDYMINLGGLRFNDFSVRLSPEAAVRFNRDFDDFNEEDFERYKKNLKPEYAPYLGMIARNKNSLVVFETMGPRPYWIPDFGRFARSTGKEGLLRLYEGLTSEKRINNIVGELQGEYGDLIDSAWQEETDVVIFSSVEETKEPSTKKLTAPVSLGLAKGMRAFMDDNAVFLSEVLNSGTARDKLIRIPVEVIEAAGSDSVNDFLAAFQDIPCVHIELFYGDSILEVDERGYSRYGIREKALPSGFESSRANTVTVLPVLKGETLPASKVNARWKLGGIPPEETIVAPVGFKYDRAGLIRSIFLGLRLSEIARNDGYGKDSNFVYHTLTQYMDLCLSQGLSAADFDLTGEDLVNIAREDISAMVMSLNKLIRLLPIMPVNTEELRYLYERAKEVVIRA